MRLIRLRFATLLLALVGLASPAEAAGINNSGSITWDWAFSVNFGGSNVQAERGTFTTNYVAGATNSSAPAGTYAISDLSITSDALGLKLGSIGGTGRGFIESDFQWDGRSATNFYTKAFGSFSNPEVVFGFPQGNLIFQMMGRPSGTFETTKGTSYGSSLFMSVASVTPPTPAPEPSTIVLGLLGLGALAGRAYRRRASGG